MTRGDGKYQLPTRFGKMLRDSDKTSGVGSGLGGASASPLLFTHDEWTLTSGGAQTKTLTFLPVDGSAHVYLNGVYQREGTDYDLDDEALDLLTAAGALTDDVLDVRYAYAADSPVSVAEDVDPPVLVQAASADDSASGTATANFDDPTMAGNLLVATLGGRANLTSMPAGWVSVSKFYSPSTDTFIEVWYLEDAPATTSVTATTDVSNGMRLVIAEFADMPASVTATLGGTLGDFVADGTTFTPSAAPSTGLAILGWNSRYGSDLNVVGYADVGPGAHESAMGYVAVGSGDVAAAVLSPGTPIGTNAFMIVYLT